MPAVNFGCGIAVVAHCAIRAVTFLYLNQRAERDHLALPVAGFESGDVFWLIPELRIRLGDDLVGPAKAVEIVHVKRAEINLHRLEKVCERDALLLGFDAIDVRIQLRHVDGEGGKDPGESRRLIALADHSAKSLEQSVISEVGSILHIQFESANRAQTHHWRRRHGEDKAVLDRGKLLVQRAGNGWPAELCAPPLLKRLQTKEDDPGIGRDAEAIDAQAWKCHRRLYSRLLQSDVRHAPDDRLGAVQRSGIGQLRERHEILLVLGRHETGRNLIKPPNSEQNQAAIDQQGNGALANNAADSERVFVAGPRKHAVEWPKKPPEQFLDEPLQPVAGMFSFSPGL